MRAQQRASTGGGWKRAWKRTALDGFFTAATFGLGQTLRVGMYARYPKWFYRGGIRSWGKARELSRHAGWGGKYIYKGIKGL